MKYIIYNSPLTKGVIVEADDMDKARKYANRELYSPYPNKHDLICGTVLHEGLNHEFDGKLFAMVQYHFSGEGSSGVVTDYDCTIYAPITKGSLDFIGKSKIDHIEFYKTREDQC
jgi:hypothetical protein